MVDNAPSDDRSREVAPRWGVRYVTEPVRGLSRARNRGARSCETEIVAYIDDDAVAEPDWLTMLVRDFEDPSSSGSNRLDSPMQGSIETWLLQREQAIPYRSERGQRRSHRPGDSGLVRDRELRGDGRWIEHGIPPQRLRRLAGF